MPAEKYKAYTYEINFLNSIRLLHPLYGGFAMIV